MFFLEDKKLINFGLKSFRIKIILLVVLAVFLLLALGLANYYYNNYKITEYFTTYDKLLKIREITEKAEAILILLRDIVSDPYNKGDIVKYRNFQNEIGVLKKDILLNKDPATQNDMDNFFSTLDALLESGNEIITISPKLDHSSKNYYNKTAYQLDNLRVAAQNYIFSELKLNSNLRELTSQKITSTYFQLLIIIILIIAFILIYISFILKKVIRDTEKLMDLSKQISKGNLNVSEVQSNSNDEIGVLVKAFNHMIVGLQRANEEVKNTQEILIQTEKFASLGSLVAGVSHEVNTPLGISITAAEYLKDKYYEIHNEMFSKGETPLNLRMHTKNVEETFLILTRNLLKANDLIKSFKMIAVDQSGEAKRLINIKKYIEDTILSMKHVIKMAFVNVKVECSSDDLIVNTTAGAISQIITNLIMNSIIHAFENTTNRTIDISISQETDIKNNVPLIVLCYHDNGKGIEKDIIKKIFDPFFTTNRGNGGSGLGLSIVFNLVTNILCGTIECTSQLSEGVTFLIKFPK